MLGSINRTVLAAALFASISSTLLGYDVGVTSGAILYLRDTFHLTTIQEELFVSSLSLTSLFGALAAGRISDMVGRKRAMGFASLIFLAGSLIMAFSPNYGILMTGRVITGVGVGFALIMAPLYTAELSPPAARGSLVSLGELFINAGILIGYLSSFLLSGLPEKVSWRWMLGLGAVPAVALGLGMMGVPESPRWLVLQGKITEARKVLIQTSNHPDEVTQRLNEILEAAGVSQVSAGSAGGGEGEGEVVGVVRDSGAGVWRDLVWPSPAVFRMLVLCVGVNFYHQATGVDAIIYYSPTMFQEAGINNRRALLGATVGIGVTKTLFCVIATGLVDRFGRRPMLIGSCFGMTLSLLGEALGFILLRQGQSFRSSLDGSPDSGFAPALTIIFACAFVASFSLGLGPICWVLTSEIFPLRLRAQAFGVGTAVNRLTSGIVALTFLSLGDLVSPGGCFLIFAGIGVSSVVFFYVFCPETKGKSLEEIAGLFEVNEKIALNDNRALLSERGDMVGGDEGMGEGMRRNDDEEEVWSSVIEGPEEPVQGVNGIHQVDGSRSYDRIS